MTTTDLTGMSEDEVLAFCGGRVAAIADAQAALLEGAYQWAVLNPAERLQPGEWETPGRERAMQYGGDGTPLVCEFAAAELGARIGRTTRSAAILMGDALDLHHRHPVLMAGIRSGRVQVGHARFVVSKTRELPPQAAAEVDVAVAPYADGRLPWSRFQALVAGQVAQAAPEIAREREQRARAMFAKKLRPRPEEAPGMAAYLVHADVARIDQLDAGVAAYAEAIAEDFPDLDSDELRVQALLLLVTPESDAAPVRALAKAAPTVNLYVHTYADPDGAVSPVARLEGHGPVTTEWVREVLGPWCRFRVMPVVDLAGMAPVGAYEIPDRHRQAVHLMTPADVFPWGSSVSRAMQIDHTEAYRDGDASAIGNYGPLSTPHHRIKTHGNWQVRQPFPGIYLWRDPHGHHYLVDHTGTRRTRPGERRTERPRPVVMEIYREMGRTEFALGA